MTLYFYGNLLLWQFTSMASHFFTLCFFTIYSFTFNIYIVNIVNISRCVVADKAYIMVQFAYYNLNN